MTTALATTTTAITTPNIADLTAKLQRQLDALGHDERHVRSQAERAKYRTDYDSRSRVISGLMNVPNDIARDDAQIALIGAERAEVLAKEAELRHDLDAAADWRTVVGGRERDKEYDRQQHLKRQLAMLREGDLLRAPDVAYRRLRHLDARLADLNKERDARQSTLELLVTQAQALIAESHK